jgi:hypothetical protein
MAEGLTVTILESSVEIAAPRASVWELLATLDALEVLLDAAIVRRRWRAGIEAFLRGLKRLAETKAGNVVS